MLRVCVLVCALVFCNGNDASKFEDLEKRINRLEKEHRTCLVKETEKRASNPASPAVAFSAYLSSDVHPVAYNEAIIYNAVKLNEGDAYNAHVGRFKAPIAGIYHFVASVQSYSSDYIDFELVRDGSYLCRGRGSRTYESTGTCASTVHLNVGSDVWVRHYSTNGNFIKGSGYSSFTGHLVHAD
ncbi:complement C1q tumor necrosis factor-related protein 2-like [Saccostrea cucullata]|uniref:complement C1q tumor necrosis factor-related protein 2-like n=1 Tax=Saccostrea cuccullata TaxID=36930 RepID=UPI002ED05159